MTFGSVKRFEWVMAAGTLVVVCPFWVAGLRWIFLASPMVSSVLSVGLIGTTLLLSVPFFGRVALFLILAEAAWALYLVFSPGALFDLDLRRKKGKPYERLVPHLIALGIVVLTYMFRDALHVEDTLGGLGRF
jgi:hypothetical protein